MKVSTPKRITNDPIFCMKKNLCWTADGQQIVFSREYGIEYCICSIHPDGTGFRQISESTPDKSPKVEPAWSPDGKSIAFVGTRDGNPEIYLCDPEGKDLRRITNDPARDEHPAWSPDS